MISSYPESILSMLGELGRFVDEVVVPLEMKHERVLENPRLCFDENGAYSSEVQKLMRQVRMASAKAGWYSKFSPKDAGGEGVREIAEHAAWEYLHWRYGPGRVLPYATLAVWTGGPSAMCKFFQPIVKETILPLILSGEKTLCFGLSEPMAGSDVWGMQTRASRVGDSWVINGTKTWITGSATADYALIFAVTDEATRSTKKGGLSCFLVPLDTKGLIVESISLFGNTGRDDATITMNNVEVTQDHLVGELHKGFKVAMTGVDAGRIWNAARCLGWARWALEKTVVYAKERHTFGQAIIGYQAVSHKLAECAIKIATSKQMSLSCAREMEAGNYDIRRDLAIAKAYSTEMCFDVFDKCIQINGGKGFLSKTKFYAGWHESRIVRIAEGSSEILRDTIVKELMRGNVSF